MPSGTAQPKSQTMGIVIALSILVAVGFLVLYFKMGVDTNLLMNDMALLSQQVASTHRTVASPIKQSAALSFSEYLKTYQQKPVSLSVQQQAAYVKAFSYAYNEPCDPTSDEMCNAKTKTISSGVDIYSDQGWNDGGNHVFYIVYGIEGPSVWYGPFTDNVSRLNMEANALIRSR